MTRKILTAALGSAAIVIGGVAIAAPGGSHGGGPGAGMNPGGAASMGPANASPTAPGRASPDTDLNSPTTTTSPTTRTTTDTDNDNDETKTTTSQPSSNPAAGVSQGPMHASPNGIAHANSHSVLARGAVSSATLPGLTTGLTVNNKAGTAIGTVSQVVTDTSGNIRLVVVTSPTGQSFRLAPNTLSISGGVVTTTGM